MNRIRPGAKQGFYSRYFGSAGVIDEMLLTLGGGVKSIELTSFLLSTHDYNPRLFNLYDANGTTDPDKVKIAYGSISAYASPNWIIPPPGLYIKRGLMISVESYVAGISHGYFTYSENRDYAP